MTWSEVFDAMQTGRYIRRASWHEGAVIRINFDDYTFYCTPSAKQYFDIDENGRWRFKKSEHPTTDWVICDHKYNFDNDSWYYVGTP